MEYAVAEVLLLQELSTCSTTKTAPRKCIVADTGSVCAPLLRFHSWEHADRATSTWHSATAAMSKKRQLDTLGAPSVFFSHTRRWKINDFNHAGVVDLRAQKGKQTETKAAGDKSHNCNRKSAAFIHRCFLYLFGVSGDQLSASVLFNQDALAATALFALGAAADGWGIFISRPPVDVVSELFFKVSECQRANAAEAKTKRRPAVCWLELKWMVPCQRAFTNFSFHCLQH